MKVNVSILAYFLQNNHCNNSNSDPANNILSVPCWRRCRRVCSTQRRL